MYIDSHCHLFDLKEYNSNFIDELSNLDIIVITSSTNLEEFNFNEELSKKIEENITKILPCFAIHPQFLTMKREKLLNFDYLLELLDKLAREKRIAAIGECGFDLYNDEYKATEEWQDEVFGQQLEIAVKYDLPVVLHVRRAMHKIFKYTNLFKKCKAVIFHSWPGTLEEGQALLKRGINVYFSFGNTILFGHKQQVRSIMHLPLDRLLTETDAPYQPMKGKKFSSWKDLPHIIEKIAILRNVNSKDIEKQIYNNFMMFSARGIINYPL